MVDHRGVEKYAIYLDWNIIDGLGKGRFPKLNEKLAVAKKAGLILTPDSEFTMYEACNTLRSDDIYLSQNLERIALFCDSLYLEISEDKKSKVIRKKHPTEVYDMPRYKLFIAYTEQLAPILQAIGTVGGKMARMGFRPGLLNNVPKEEVIPTINQMLQSPEILSQYSELFPDVVTFEFVLGLGFQNLPDLNDPIQIVSSIFFMIDWFGYHSEKNTSRKANSTFRDGMHAAMGAQLDVLISDDRRMAKKAALTYHILPCETQAFGVDEAVQWLDSIN